MFVAKICTQKYQLKTGNFDSKTGKFQKVETFPAPVCTAQLLTLLKMGRVFTNPSTLRDVVYIAVRGMG